MYCMFCGKQIADDSAFCEHCGARQEPAAPPPVPPAGEQPSAPIHVPQSAPVQQAGPVAPIAAEKKPMSPKAKRTLIALAAAVVVLVGAKLVLGTLFSSQKAIDSFLTAVQTQDADAFRAAVTETSVELSDEAVAGFFAAYGGEEGALSAFRQILMEDAAALERGMEIGEDRLLRLTEKSYLLFSTYSVEIRPTSVTFCSEFDGASVQVAGQELADVGQDGTQVLLFPGCYDVAARYTSPDTGVALETEMKGCMLTGERSAVDIRFHNYVDAYIAGSTQKLTLREIQIDGRTYTGDLSGADLFYGISVGPVRSDSRIKVTAEAFGMEFEQEFDLAVDGTRCYIVADLSQEMREEAARIAAEVAVDWMRVVYAYDRDALKRMGDSGTVSDGLLTDLDEWLSAAWNSAEEVFCVRFDSISCDAEEGAVSADVGEICSAYVVLPVTSSGTTGFLSLATGEFTEYTEYMLLEDTVFYGGVYMVYEEGRWVVSYVEMDL